MSQRPRHPLLGYVVAIAAVALAFVFRHFAAPVLGDRAPFFPFGLAVLFAAWTGGFLPGLVATLLGSAGGLYFFLLPTRPRGLEAGDLLSVGIFVVFSLVTSALFEQVRRYQNSAARDAERMDHVHDAILSWERRTSRVLSWNAGAARLYGIPHDEAIGRNVHALLRTAHERGLESVLGILDRSGEWAGELTHRTRDGSTVYVSSRMTLIEERRGEEAVLEVNRDISDRKRREARQAESLRLHTSVYELIDRLQHARSASDVYGAALSAIRDALRCSRASILLFDAGGAMRFVASAGLSEEYRRAVDGHSPWTADARHPEPIVVPDVAAADMDASLKSVVRNEGIAALAFVPLVAEDRLIGKFMAYFDGPHDFTREEIEAAVAIGRELGFGLQRARSEALVRASEEHLSREASALARLNEISASLWRKATLEDGLVAILDAALEILGAERGNVQLWHAGTRSLRVAAQRGLDAEFLDGFREVQENESSVCGQALRTGTRAMVEDVEVSAGLAEALSAFRRAGIRAVQSTPLRRWDGTPIGMVSTHWGEPHRAADQDLRRLDLFLRTATDFIERYAADEELRREVGERQRAEEALRNNVAELKKATVSLEESDRRKNEFLATLGHELRNPLAPLTTGLELLRRLGLSEDAEQVRGMMERQVGSMARLVDDLLDVNRITTGRLKLQRETLPLSTVLQRAIETSRPLVEERSHRLSLSIADDAFLDADPTRLSQVFVALLNNAAKYTDPRGSIAVAAHREGREIVVSVRDSGRGISASDLPNIFHMFSRTSRAIQSGEAGLGVGLSLARSLAELHGGSIEARSGGLGKGSEFEVRLPALNAVSRTEAEADATTAPASAGRALRVLVVDDNRDAAASLAMLLEAMGSRVRTAFDGEEAAVAASEFLPHLALLDIGMPALDGYEAARRIRREASGRPLFLVALTGYGQESDRQKSAEAGFDRHLVKPLRPQILVDLLAELEKGNPVSPSPSAG